MIETPATSNSTQSRVIKFTQNTMDNYLTPANPKTPQKQRTRTITLSSVDVPSKSENQRKLKLNNISVQYIPDTGATISVISENVAKAIPAEVKPYDWTKIKAITADGKEVQDVSGFAEVEVFLGNQKLEKVKKLVFKNATNPCLIGRDVLASHPDTKHHFVALMGRKLPMRWMGIEVPKQSVCNTRHCDRSSDDDYDEMDDKFSDNSATKGCLVKNKTKIDEGIQT